MENSTVIEQPGFTICWEDLREYLECFSDREIGRILRALYAAVTEGREPELRHAEKLPFLHLKKNVLLQEKRYRETKEQNRKNGSKGGKTKKAGPEAAGTDRSKKEAAANDRKPTQAQTQTKTLSSSLEEDLPSGQKQTDEAASLPEGTTPDTSGGGAKTCDDRFASSVKTSHAETQPTPEQREMFLQFRKAYPKKTNIAQAEPLFLKALETVSLDTILNAVRQQKYTDDWQKERGKYVPLAEKWLRDRCWEDEPAEWDDGYEILNLF